MVRIILGMQIGYSHKYLGLRLIKVGEMFRLNYGKVVLSLLRENIVSSVGSIEVCAEENEGFEET